MTSFSRRPPSAIQTACPEAFSSTNSTKYSKDHSFVIVGVGLDKNLDEVKVINKTYPAKMNLVRIRSRATQAPTRLLRAFTRCETRVTLLISRGLLIGLTHHRRVESIQAQPSPSFSSSSFSSSASSSSSSTRRLLIQCYQCQHFGHTANACTQEVDASDVEFISS